MRLLQTSDEANYKPWTPFELSSTLNKKELTKGNKSGKAFGNYSLVEEIKDQAA